MAVGTIFTKDRMIIRIDVGSASRTDEPRASGDKDPDYEMSISLPDNAPIVRSFRTGKWYYLDWKDIVALAVEAGIDNEVPSV